MNKRIREIYQQATGKTWIYDFDPSMAETFAELIIKECLSIADNRGAYQVMDDIIERFGVEL